MIEGMIETTEPQAGATQTGTFTGTLDGEPMTGTITITKSTPPPQPDLSQLVVSPATVVTGQGVSVLVARSAASPQPLSVAILAPGLLVPATVTIGPGAQTASFTVQTGALGVFSITASTPTKSLTSQLTVQPQPPSTVVNVRDYGAKGDGITDDAPAIQRAIDATTSGKTVFVPAGNYKLSRTLSLWKSGVGFEGEGDASVLNPGGNRGLYVFNRDGGLTDVRIRLLKLVGLPGKWLAAGNVNHAILIDGAQKTLVQQVRLVGVGQGVYSVNQGNGTIHDRVEVDGWGGTAFGLWAGAVVKDCLAIQDDPGPSNTSGHGIYLHSGGTNITIERTEIRNARLFGMQMYGETVGMSIGPVVMRDCIFRGCFGAFALSNYPAEAARAQNTVIQRCQFLGTYGGNAVTIQQGDGLDFSDNVVDGSPNFGVCFGVWPASYANGVLRNCTLKNTTIRNCTYGLGAGSTAASPGRFENCVIQGSHIEPSCPRPMVLYDNTQGITILP